MRETDKIFHLAIPCKDLDETADFYQKLGCKVARRYDDRVTFNFFGDQVVCHLSPEKIDPTRKCIPAISALLFWIKQHLRKPSNLQRKTTWHFSRRKWCGLGAGKRNIGHFSSKIPPTTCSNLNITMMKAWCINQSHSMLKACDAAFSGKSRIACFAIWARR